MPRKDTTTAKHALIASFGGACQRCGYSRCLRALHFHHKDASEKAEWSRGRGNASPDEVAQYPERFILVCANCHAEIHDEEAKQRRRQRAVHCLACGKLLTPDPARQAAGRDRYCARACQHAHRIILAASPEAQKQRLRKHVCIEGECWIWTGYALRGAGLTFFTTPEGQRVECTARRLAYLLYHGPIPEGMEIGSTCSHTLCVSPDHIVARPRGTSRFSM